MVPAWFASDGYRYESLRQGDEQRLCFEASDVLSDALVDAHAESHVARWVAPQIELVGLSPATRVAVGRAEEHQDLFAVGHRDIADGDVTGGSAEEGLHR